MFRLKSALTQFDKFWVIWISCLDKPRTIKDIQRLWDYGGNALYQKGIKKPIWEEMVDQNYIKRFEKVKKRGVSGLTLQSKLNWVSSYLDDFSKSAKYDHKNYLVSDILNCVKNKKDLIRFLKENRQTFFFIDKIKILFGNKENLKSNYEMAIFAPLLSLLNLYTWRALQKRMGVDENISFFLTSTFIFNMNPRINFIDYFRQLVEDIKDLNIPSTIFDKARIFRIWKRYTESVTENMF